jgi:hypothetical protein
VNLYICKVIVVCDFSYHLDLLVYLVQIPEMLLMAFVLLLFIVGMELLLCVLTLVLLLRYSKLILIQRDGMGPNNPTLDKVSDKQVWPHWRDP